MAETKLKITLDTKEAEQQVSRLAASLDKETAAPKYRTKEPTPAQVQIAQNNAIRSRMKLAETELRIAAAAEKRKEISAKQAANTEAKESRKKQKDILTAQKLITDQKIADEKKIVRETKAAQRQLLLDKKTAEKEAAKPTFGGQMKDKLFGGMGLKSLALGVGGALAVGQLAKGVYDYGVNSYGSYEEGMGTRRSLIGRGRNQFDTSEGTISSLSKANMTLQEYEQQQLKDMDIFSKGGASGANVLARRRFEDVRGLDKGALSDAGASLRPILGGERTTGAIAAAQKSLVASGVKEGAGAYFKTLIALTASINSSNLSNSTAIANAMAVATKAGATPEIAARQLSTMNSAISGSTGEANAFLQLAYARGGVSGSSILSAQTAVQGGLFGEDLTGLGANAQKQLAKYGNGNYRTRSKAIGDMFKSLGINYGEGAKEKDLLQAGTVSMGITGAPTAISSLRSLKLLDKLGKGGLSKAEEADVKKQMEDIESGKTTLPETAQEVATMNVNAKNVSVSYAQGEAEGGIGVAYKKAKGGLMEDALGFSKGLKSPADYLQQHATSPLTAIAGRAAGELYDVLVKIYDAIISGQATKKATPIVPNAKTSTGVGS